MFRSRKRRSGIERRLDARLDDEERDQERRGDGQQTERPRGAPADLVPVHDRVDGEHQRRGHRDCAGDVELLRRRRDARGRNQHEREDHDGDPDRAR